MKTVYEQIRRYGQVRRGTIGIDALTITPRLADALDLGRLCGVLVEDVYPNSPADRANIQVGDIILSLDGKPMENARQFDVSVYFKPLLEPVEIRLLRDGQELAVNPIVQEIPASVIRFSDLIDVESNLVDELSVVALDIDASVKRNLPPLRKHGGVLVAALPGNATGAQSLFKAGDIIYAINGTVVTSIEGLRSAMAAIPKGKIRVAEIQRRGRLKFLLIDEQDDRGLEPIAASDTLRTSPLICAY